mmetsp:Transcript_35998/g.47482  ORF Transcript_35998/g.47482 Transcript_35998/m.47482 type:complete len:303 (+) Transcript_35998:75-983(+)
MAFYCLLEFGYIKIESSETPPNPDNQKVATDGDQKQPADPCSLNASKISTKVLRVGDKSFIVCPDLLERYSSYFKNMFSTFKEKDMESIEIGVPFPENLEKMLFFLHFGKFGDPPTNKNIIEMLINAEFLGAQSMIDNLCIIVAKNWEIVQGHCPKFIASVVPKHLMLNISSLIHFKSAGEKLGFYCSWLKGYFGTLLDLDGMSDILKDQLDLGFEYNDLKYNEIKVAAKAPEIIGMLWPNAVANLCCFKIKCKNCNHEYRIPNPKCTITLPKTQMIFHNSRATSKTDECICDIHNGFLLVT